jgi:hypothetical protein
MERAISLRDEPQHCRAGYMCYYAVQDPAPAQLIPVEAIAGARR